MPALDIFNQDPFSAVGLTAAINEQPHLPGRIGQLGLFEAQGITTTTVMIEKKAGTLRLVPSAARGSGGQHNKRDKRTMIPFPTVHLPQQGEVLADEVQNVRGFGMESELESVQNVVNMELARMRRDLDATIEYHRIGAINGQVLDSDGTSVILNIFTAFGLTQQSQAMALGTTTTKVRTLVLAAKRKAETALGGTPIRGFRALCGDDFFDKFIDHDDVKAAYARYLDGESLRNDPRGGFDFAGVIWENYRGSVDGNLFVPTGEARLVPEGVPGLFITRFAPGDYIEAVNTVGLPYYAKQELMRFDKGVDLEAQSNPLNLCTQPRAVIKLTTN